MCIIVAKGQNVKFPEMSVLEQCFKNNSDGAGLMWASHGSVFAEKGFMDFKHFEKFITKLKEDRNLDELSMVLHFRITTHGGTSPQLTHPFPITDEPSMLKALSFKSKIAVAHNGIISMANSGLTLGLSDTQMFIKDYMSLMEFPRQIKTKNGKELIHKMISSKMCFLEGDGTLTYVGAFTEDEGIFYSNNTYKEYRYNQSDYLNHSAFSKVSSYSWVDHLMEVVDGQMIIDVDLDGMIENTAGYYFDEHGFIYENLNHGKVGSVANFEYIGQGGVYDKNTYELIKFSLAKAKRFTRTYSDLNY